MPLKGQSYVDKSTMLSFTNTLVNTPQRYLCVSRPHRFGKTTVLDMLCAYYVFGADDRDVFATQKLGQHSNWDKHLGAFHVLRITMTQFLSKAKEMEKLVEKPPGELAEDFEEAFPDIPLGHRPDLINMMEKAYARTQRQFVALIDEWDAVFREYRDAGNRTYNSEAALSYAVQLAYYKAQDEYTVIPELDTGKGYADLVYLPKNAGRPAILVELKHSQDAETAIDQILRKDYPSRLEHYQGNLILIGISYDRSADPKAPNFKHHSCRLLRA